MIKVYHFPSELIRYVPYFDPARQAEFATLGFSKYHLVAEVDTDELKDAFMLTRSLYGHWSTNDRVEAHQTSRSTGICDVMEKDGKFFVVANTGFNEISVE